MIAPIAAATTPPDPKAAAPAANKDARATATKFEALVTGEMLKAMRSAQLDDDALGSEAQTHWTEMRDRQFAQTLAERAPLGLAAQLESAPK